MVEIEKSIAEDTLSAKSCFPIGPLQRRSHALAPSEDAANGPSNTLTRPGSPSLTAPGLNPKPTMTDHATTG